MKEKKSVKKELRKKVASVDQKIGKEIKWWGKASPAIKGVLIFVVMIMFLLALPENIKITIAFSGLLLRGLEMTGIIQICLVELLLLVVLNEIQTKGILSTITRIIFVVLAIKLAGEWSGVDTKAIDEVLAWIANIPNLIAKDLIPWLRFW